jgi:hypothetical protein
MAPRTKEPRAHEVEVTGVQEIYRTARAQADEEMAKLRGDIDAIRAEAETIGSLKAISATVAHQELLKALTLYKLKESKSYKSGGLTWAEFCESIDMPVRTVDTMLSDMRPLFEEFSAATCRLSVIPFNKIRLLGKQVSAELAEIRDNCLIYGDESIPLAPEFRDDIQALIERIVEESKEKVETLEAQVSAKDKVLKSKEDVINKQERQLKKYDKDAAAKGMTTDEDAFLQLMFNKRTAFDGYLLSVDPDFVMENAGEVTPRMRAALISTLQYMKMQMLVICETSVTHYGADMAPEVMEEFEDWFKQQEAAVPE